MYRVWNYNIFATETQSNKTVKKNQRKKNYTVLAGQMYAARV